jgi:NodT family efflux transporter outer membrane factor (OMF) lipoprotein
VTRSLAAIILLVLSGCTVGPDYRRSETAVAETWLEPAAPGAVDTEWWRRFGDPQLASLVERAIASSPDLREAEARLAEARANHDAARGGRLPQVRATGSATENVLSKNGQLPVASIPGFDREFSLFDLGFDASWELDFWGSNRRRVEATEARVDAARWGRRDALVSLVAELARNYVELRGAQADLAVARERVAILAQLAELTRLRFEAGEASRIEAEQARSQRAAAAVARDALAAEASAAAYRIAVLVGDPPEEVVPSLRENAPIPKPPQTIVSGVRSELLKRRPDVRRAERELAAATAEIGVATADLFPRFSLMGNLGLQARSPGDLLSEASGRLMAGPSFSWPIFSGGRIRAQIRATDARAEAAVARYDKAVLAALAESESAANRFANASSAAVQASASLERELAAHRLAELRVERGEDDRLALMRARLRLLEAQTRERDAAKALSTAAIALYKSLGGGWAVGVLDQENACC